MCVVSSKPCVARLPTPVPTLRVGLTDHDTRAGAHHLLPTLRVGTTSHSTHEGTHELIPTLRVGTTDHYTHVGTHQLVPTLRVGMPLPTLRVVSQTLTLELLAAIRTVRCCARVRNVVRGSPTPHESPTDGLPAPASAWRVQSPWKSRPEPMAGHRRSAGPAGSETRAERRTEVGDRRRTRLRNPSSAGDTTRRVGDGIPTQSVGTS
jgi:hypothetical protein